MGAGGELTQASGQSTRRFGPSGRARSRGRSLAGCTCAAHDRASCGAPGVVGRQFHLCGLPRTHWRSSGRRSSNAPRPGPRPRTLVRRVVHDGPSRGSRVTRTGRRGADRQLVTAAVLAPASAHDIRARQLADARTAQRPSPLRPREPFYQLWLDRELVYTCAYFEDPEMSLEDAQVAKLDLVCRKLRLRPGETVVEAGCGWGALAIHMARNYGVHVRAFNVSREQLAYARARAAREGLGDRVEFIDDDYRNVSGEFDVFVSVGMLEHVGLAALSQSCRRAASISEARSRARPAAFHRPRRSSPIELVDHPPDLSGRVSTDAGGSDDGHPRAGRHVGRRRGESAPALSRDARALERPVRLGQRSSPGDLWRGVPPRVGAVPRRLAGRIRDGMDAAIPGGLRASRNAATVVDSRGCLRRRSEGLKTLRYPPIGFDGSRSPADSQGYRAVSSPA